MNYNLAISALFAVVSKGIQLKAEVPVVLINVSQPTGWQGGLREFDPEGADHFDFINVVKDVKDAGTGAKVAVTDVADAGIEAVAAVEDDSSSETSAEAAVDFVSDIADAAVEDVSVSEISEEEDYTDDETGICDCIDSHGYQVYLDETLEGFIIVPYNGAAL